MRLIANIFFLCCASYAAGATAWTVSAKPAKLLNGAPVLFEVRSAYRFDSLTGSWCGHQLTFSYDSSAKLWFALAGVPFETKPGKYALELAGERAGSKVAVKREFPVGAASYPKIKVELSVEKKFTEPNPEQTAQIEEAKKIKSDYFSRPATERSWDGTFTAPVEAETSDVYGSQRIFNGEAQSPHWGLDYRVHTGTPVKAMNSGTVLLARFLYYEGNFVVIDHGQGLMTLYLHLSELKVKAGDAVKRGQEVGLSGGTGRATGPHLDVRVRWQSTYLDPARLLQLPLP
jgi:murein DD-endopeptidase MepM/ murein hydrolase activator NlpD